MPVHNGIATINRAIGSLLKQAYPSWELIAVDDGSSDGTYDRLLHWSRQDKRIRVFRTESNRGPGAARNQGLRIACGEFVSYLDCDDEYYPDFLEKAAALRDRADVLVFGYDYVVDGETPPKVHTWDPIPHRGDFFAANLSTPLGIVHRRELAAMVGGFDESLWCQEDWEFWKRLARSGAEFLFLPHRSGLYHFRQGARSHTPRLTTNQRGLYESNRNAAAALYKNSSGRPARQRPVRSAVFVASEAYVSASHPLGVAASALMELLARSGLACQAYCSVPPTEQAGESIERTLEHMGLPRQTRPSLSGSREGLVTDTVLGRVPVTLVRPITKQQREPHVEAVTAFLAFFDTFLERNRPDVLLTYSPVPSHDPLIRLAKRYDIPIVVPVLDVPHQDRLVFSNADYCLVSTEQSRQRYWEELGLNCVALPPAIDWDRTYAPEREGRFVTFLAPLAGRGLLLFARIAEQLAERRPDIPVLVVDDATSPTWQGDTGLDLRRLGNVVTMGLVRHPRDYYGVTRILVTPWAGDTPIAFSVAEAKISGIPVVASNCGPLPELVGSAGFLLGIPPSLKMPHPHTPTPEEVEPWVDRIVRLWDDASLYEELSTIAREDGLRWRSEQVGPLYAEFVRHAHPQPGPPFIPLPPPGQEEPGDGEAQGDCWRLRGST